MVPLWPGFRRGGQVRWCVGGSAGVRGGGGGCCAGRESARPAELCGCCVCVPCVSCGLWLAAVLRCIRVGLWCVGSGWLLADGAGGGASGGAGVLLVGPSAVGARVWPPASPWGCTVAQMSWARTLGAEVGAGACGGGGKVVLAVCGTMVLVGAVVRVGGGGRCARGIHDGVVRCVVPRGPGGLCWPSALGRGADAAGGGHCSIGA